MNFKAARPIHGVVLKLIAFKLDNTLDIKIDFILFYDTWNFFFTEQVGCTSLQMKAALVNWQNRTH